MTRDDIICMAQECQLIGMRPHLDGIYEEALQRFAALVAAAERERLTKAAMSAAKIAIEEAMQLEREACAKVCEETLTHHYIKKMADKDHPMLLAACADCAAAIRARGET